MDRRGAGLLRKRSLMLAILFVFIAGAGQRGFIIQDVQAEEKKSEGKNLILNPSFESEKDGMPTDWDEPRADFTSSLDSSTKMEGKFSYKVSTTVVEEWKWSFISSSDVIPVEKGNYQFSVWVKMKNVKQSHVKIIGYDEDGEAILQNNSDIMVVCPSGTDGTWDWEKYEVKFNPHMINPLCTQVKVFLMAGWSPNGEEAITWFDDVSLVKLKIEEVISRKSFCDWLKDAIICEVSVEYFANNTFKGLEEKIPELKELGITCIYLMPIHKKGIKKAGGSPYCIKDYYSIRKRNGVADDLKSLIKTAHKYGMKVILDMVANHCSWDSVIVNEHPEWCMHNEKGEIVSPGPWPDVVQLDYSKPELRDYMVAVIKYWVKEFDIDGYRCDVAHFVPIEFWKRAREELEKIKPGIMLLAESGLPEFPDMFDAFDMGYVGLGFWDFFNKAVKCEGDVTTIYSWWKEEDRWTSQAGGLWMRIIENHDTKRARSVYGLKGSLLGGALITTIPGGVPMIYAGQELGYEGREPSPYSQTLTSEQIKIRDFYKKLFSIRGKHKCLKWGSMLQVTSSAPHTDAFLRIYEDNAVIVVFNFSKEEAITTLSLPISGIKIDPRTQYVLCDELEGKKFSVDGKNLQNFQIEIPAQSAYIFVLPPELAEKISKAF